MSVIIVRFFLHLYFTK